MTDAPEIPHFLGGRRAAGTSGRYGDVFDPSTGAVQGRVALASAQETRAAIADAAAAQPAWAALNPQRRARVLMRFLALANAELDSLAALLSREHGKTLADSRGDIQRGLEVVEFAVGVPHLLKGEYSESAGSGIDVYSMRQPLGVVAGITPFNFPAMVPMWKLAPAIACGNAFVLKPSERDPSVPLRLAELMVQAGLPPGVLNVVNGDREAVDALLTDPRVAAVGFVGSSAVAEYVYATATNAGKRAQCFGGAKNHLVVMPDADIDEAVEALLGAGFGTAGERCMAISVAVPVGERTAAELMARLVARVRRLKVGPPQAPDSDYGPLITADALRRVREYIAVGLQEGAELVIDGRELAVGVAEGGVADGGVGEAGAGANGRDPGGFYIGPSLFDRVEPGMRIYREEIFGPVLSVVRADSYEAALSLANDHEYGNGVAIFTRDGAVARDFSSRVNTGMVGVNVAIPVPIAYHTFGGWKRSGFGDLNQHGPDSIRFYTKTKTVTARWSGIKDAASFALPTMG